MRYYEKIESLPDRAGPGPEERRGALIAGALLAGLPVAAWLYRGSLDWSDGVVALAGVALVALALAPRKLAPQH